MGYNSSNYMMVDIRDGGWKGTPLGHYLYILWYGRGHKGLYRFVQTVALVTPYIKLVRGKSLKVGENSQFQKIFRWFNGNQTIGSVGEKLDHSLLINILKDTINNNDTSFTITWMTAEEIAKKSNYKKGNHYVIEASMCKNSPFHRESHMSWPPGWDEILTGRQPQEAVSVLSKVVGAAKPEDTTKGAPPKLQVYHENTSEDFSEFMRGIG